MLKYVRIALLTLFVLALVGAGGIFYYGYTHDDISPPVFRSNSDLIEVSVNDPESVLLSGLSAYDNIDGDLTKEIRIKDISQLVNDTDVVVTYIVFDAASNYATCTRTARYTDYTPPHFSMTKPMTFNAGETISFLDRIKVTDQRDGNITGRLKLEESSAVSSIPGTYAATVSVSNRMGDTVYLPLTVQVLNNSFSRPRIELRQYLIYVKQGSRPQFRRYISKVVDPLEDDEVTIPNSEVSMNAGGVDLSTPGVYEVYYYYTGQSGETATSILTVVVE